MTIHIGRREFIVTVSGVALAWPLAARAQQGERVRRVGALGVLAKDDPEAKAHEAAFQQALAGLGWTVGGNLRIDYRWAAGDANRLCKYSAELVGLRPSPACPRHSPRPAVSGAAKSESRLPWPAAALSNLKLHEGLKLA